MYIRESFKTILDEHDIDPIDYNEAMTNMDTHLWQKVMKAKLESMYSNQVQELLEELERIKSIGYKQVYKKKKGQNVTLETFKVILVSKSYSQKLGFNYEEASPVPMLKSFILLSITAYLNYEI